MAPLAAALASWNERIGLKAADWALRRQGPSALPLNLERRRLYILPTRAGVGFAALVLTMMAAGFNYANSLALLLTFLLAGFGLVAMHECHRNLLGLGLHAVEAPAAFARSRGRVRIVLANPTTLARWRIECAISKASAVPADLERSSRGEIELPFEAAARGVQRLGRLRVTSTHPFGLFRVWAWVNAPIEVVVYPRPRGALPLPVEVGRRSGARARGGAGADEWFGLRPFRDGDSPRQVDWKAYARESPLLVKEYSASGSERRWLSFNDLAHLELEARLEQLARWVVDAEAQGDRYALELPGVAIAADRGPQHRHRCLAALALHGSRS
jgi:uncharacterized protein (DUF58 family)